MKFISKQFFRWYFRGNRIICSFLFPLWSDKIPLWDVLVTLASKNQLTKERAEPPTSGVTWSQVHTGTHVNILVSKYSRCEYVTTVVLRPNISCTQPSIWVYMSATFGANDRTAAVSIFVRNGSMGQVDQNTLILWNAKKWREKKTKIKGKKMQRQENENKRQREALVALAVLEPTSPNPKLHASWMWHVFGLKRCMCFICWSQKNMAHHTWHMRAWHTTHAPKVGC